MTYDYPHLTVTVLDGVATVLIDNPPINLMTSGLFRSLAKVSVDLSKDDEVRVVVLRSANPEFFIAHFDVTAILEFPTNGEAVEEPELGGFDRMCEAYRTMGKVTIAELRGRVGGGGAELSSACDMRFGDLETFQWNQMEVPLGILPGGGGTQRIPRLVGIGRAMEVVLGADDVDAETAERWGFLNRAMSGDSLSAYVDALATRIASFPPAAVREAKRAVNASVERSLDEGLKYESYLFQVLLRDVDAQPSMRQYLDAGGQTRDVELRIGSVMGELFDT
ncbi:MAG: enoyl-CoA hydratase/isomerase family protein [Actinomycetota bacterium]|jgi:enoyl-CoA hydratase/carnithine racemase|nr:enoyl-CoA hydratase/isomerase family protein [Actinomycetota bacterium]MEC7434916.1 enoyl-CoA hydratase/isomerase family protein [Actinomycetota bacterium]MEC7456561.1 enoyl-CoA hydratase/isomerase family protein [Actinomycetota bacterium]MEC7667369.1 enoyl-CoA hydratase/isomerase family protein [Actinomycetota bacterium]MEC8019203.1 enoyl-CoA hydratase/isomerase family protein [Actinomycetota bacterium]